MKESLSVLKSKRLSEEVTKMLRYSIFISIFIQAAFATSQTSMAEFVADFCKYNGKHFVTITSVSHFYPVDDIQHLTLTLNRKQVYTKSVPMPIVQTNLKWGLDTVLFLESELTKSNSEKIFQIIAKTKAKTAILVLTSNASSDELFSDLTSFKRNSLFYMFCKTSNTANGTDNAIWRASTVLTLNNVDKIITHEMVQNQVGQWIEQTPNLQGLHITCTNLPWPPLFDFKDCDGTFNCTSTGYSPDYMDWMGRMLNFSWSCVKDNHKEDWGMEPINGIRNLSHGEWTGAMGNIVNGNFMVGVSSWIWNIRRSGLLDFVVNIPGQSAMAVSPKPAKFDLGLYLRPFRNDAWHGCIVTLLIMLSGIWCPRAFFSYYESTTAQKLVVTLTWFLFVLVHAYYSGALVMFFATEPSLPFSTLQDVMELYPSWKLKMLKGMDVDFVAGAERGEPLYVEFWDRIHNQPSEAVLNNFDQAISEIRSHEVVMYAAYLQLRGYLKSNPYQNHDIKVFYKTKKEYYGMILPYNSPLTPYLTQASISILQVGGIDYLTNVWVGPEVMSPSSPETVVLAGSQLILCYIVVASIAAFSFIVFVGEIVGKNIFEKKDSRCRHQNISRWINTNLEQPSCLKSP